MKERKKLVYIISDIDKALAFEWIAKRLDKELFDLSFILIVQRPAALESYLNHLEFKCFTIYYRGKKDLPVVFLKVFKVLINIRPSLVHCHLLYGSLVGLTAAWAVGVKKRIYTRHHSDYHHRYFPKGVKWDRWCNRMATQIVAPSLAVKEVLMQYEGVTEEKISIIHHGFDIEYFTQVTDDRVRFLKDKYRLKGHSPVVGVIARFTELKGIQYIIPAFQCLRNSYPQALLMLFNARGDYEKELKQLLDKMPEDSYRLIHFEPDLSAVYRLFDVFIQVSTDKTIEAFGQTYVEALASGVPSVFTLAGIAQDFIEDGNNAVVVPFKDSEAIFQALLRILQEPGLNRRLRSNGFRSVSERFALANMMRQLEQLYTRS